MNIKEIPLQELLKDKDESLEDIAICAKAIRLNVKYSGGSIQDRLDTNKRIVEKINNELARRHVAICETAPYPECNGANGCDTCEHQEED